MIDKLLEWDSKLFTKLNGMGTEFWDPFWQFCSHKLSFIPLYLFIIYLLYRCFGKEFWKPLIFIGLTVLLCDKISVLAFKEVFMRLRPSQEVTLEGTIRLLEGKGGLYGFLSSHATNVFGISTFLYFTLKKFYGNKLTLLFGWAAFVGYSRIYVGKHYPLDVICGMLLGISIGYFVFFLFKKVPIRK